MKEYNGLREQCEGWRNITYDDCLTEWAIKYGGKTAVVCEDKRLSFEELDRYTQRLSDHFYKAGLRKNDNVIFQMPNSIEWALSLLALLRIGIVPVMVLPAHGENEISGICKIAEPKAYICMNSSLHKNAESTAYAMSERFESIKHIFTGNDIKELLKRDISIKRDNKPKYTDVAMLLLSGGTTGIPKLIPRTHGDYIYDNTMISKRLSISEADVFLAVLPASHNFTLGNPGVLGTLMSGGTVIMLSEVSPIEIFEAVKKEKVTFSSMVPSVLDMCAAYRIEDSGDDISSLRFIMTGGAMLHKETEENVKRNIGCELLQIYGTAEGLNTCFEPGQKLRPDSGKQGIPISEYDVMKVIDRNGKELNFGETGELITRGPYTITHYYKNPSADAESFTNDGYYKTGDLAVINERGELTIKGRAVEQINKGGEKIMPAELENILKTNEHIGECVVAGMPDKELGEKVALFLKENKKTLTLDEVHEHLKIKGVADYKWPDRLVYVEYFPMTAVNKIDKKKLISMSL